MRVLLLYWLFIVGTAYEVDASTVPDSEPVFLAYAGPYSLSPSSAFGHLFLVFPSSSDEPLPLWDVVTFDAETFGAGPLRYVTVGIAGGYLGRYQRVDFHEKTRDYELFEDRDLWLVELELDGEQRAALSRELAATEGQWFPYTFFKKNCAYYLQDLLARATASIPAPSGVVSPTSVVETVLKSDLAGPSYFRPGASRRLEELSQEADPPVRERLRGEHWTSVAADTTWLRSLATKELLFVQEYFAWKALRERDPLSEEASSGVELLRVLSAQAARPPGPRVTSSPGRPIPPPNFHRYTRLTLSFLGAKAETSRVALRYRGALHNLDDPALAHRPLNSLELLAVEASTAGDDFRPRLDHLVIFSQRSLSPSSWMNSRGSWMLELLGRRGGLFQPTSFHTELRAGLGKTVGLVGPAYAYALVTAAGVGVCCEQLTFAPGWEAGLVWLAGVRWRTGARWSREYDVADWSRSHERVRVWARHDILDTWAVTAALERDPTGDYLRMGVDWYP